MKDWKSCPRCGSGLNRIGEGREFHVTCPQCGFFRYQNPLPTTIGLIEDRGRYLLLRRADEPKRGEWDTVGGFISLGESAEECLRREGEEELNCKLTNLSFVGTYPSIYGNTGLQTLGLAYCCNLEAQAKIKLSNESSEFKWFELAELPSVAFTDVQMALNSLL